MLSMLPPARVVLHEWDTISVDLKRAMRGDPKRNWMDILGQAVSGQLQFWRVEDYGRGYVVTQITREPGTLKRIWWIIYAGGSGGGYDDKRAIMEIIEMQAANAKCSEVRFEGRDWRKIYPDYSAHKLDGRWHFRKVLK